MLVLYGCLVVGRFLGHRSSSASSVGIMMDAAVGTSDGLLMDHRWCWYCCWSLSVSLLLPERITNSISHLSVA